METDQAKQPSKLQAIPSHIRRVIGVGAIVVVVILIALAWGLYTLTPSTQTTNSPTSSESTPTASTKSLINGFLIMESTGSVATISKINSHGEKNALVTIPTSTAYTPSAALLADTNTLIYTDNEGNLLSYSLDTGEKKVLKESVPFKENESLNNIIFFSNIVPSPDGKTLLVNAGGWECRTTALINADGSNFKRITKADCAGSDFDWTPDSKTFLVGGQKSEFGGESAMIYVAQRDNPEDGKNILPKTGETEWADEYKDVYDPKFSPDGKKIAFGYRYLNYGKEYQNAEKADNYRGIYVINTDGTGLAQVTDNQSFSTNPIWQDNNTLVYGLSNYYIGTKKGVYSISVGGQNNTVLASSSDNMYLPVSISSDKKMVMYISGVKEKNKSYTASPLTKLVVLNLENKTIKTVSDSAVSFVGWLK